MAILADIGLFSKLGGVILSRWGHVLAGITWIGLLYYFNFVQTPSLAEFEAASRVELQRKLLPRAMWWFRWGAALTLLTGLTTIGFDDKFHNSDFWKTPSGLSILTGIGLALIMFSNVWFVIWPAQKRVIANAEAVAGGGQADATVAPVARRAALASRTNTLLSIPMLFFMVATSHFAPTNHWKQFHVRAGMNIPGPGRTPIIVYAIIGVVLAGLIEANALGFLGGTGPGPLRKPLDDHRQTIVTGFVFWLILYILWELLFRA
jgi:uncharacterized membrane protein